jgi:hypothetical protein
MKTRASSGWAGAGSLQSTGEIASQKILIGRDRCIKIDERITKFEHRVSRR